ncbi:flagellar basal body rod modification protein [Methylobacterium sp. Leaf399]|uniref:flagellar hook assembly protein FlgD n=1 Tax=unclassified Methylobacterium TaxID=2615210 RepID=UPI0006F2C0A8|nr:MULTISPECIES: flagellar hook assembly protein FlgD [unclassified Methylobacterium]KQP61625.1 flagellar basal body rod modification protein [Methylobacterium sp. Leaf108]KQT19775.1 flagellar basal body rod modification protein [Methylobacterium sp. Leaf399]KQT80825.1 flagellar basal body rod modification protein [Methylobacterium sp. Leaf466]
MDVTSATSAQPATSTATAAKTGAAAKTASGFAASLNADTFLTLLVTQLKNQDPTKPMDSTEYIGQIATLSQVEQTAATNKKLDDLLASSFLSQADQIIGRTVTSADGTVSGQVNSVVVTSEGALAKFTDGRSLLLSEGITVS